MAKEIDAKVLKKLNYFRFREVKGRYFLSNEWGGYVWLSAEEFKDFTADRLDKKGEAHRRLAANNFIKEEMDLTAAIEKYRSKKDFLLTGPSLHIIVATLRCNHRCIYCHASAQDMKAKELDMTLETAAKTLDLIFKTTSPFVVIEFQGGEPLVNWPLIEFVVKEAKRRAKKLGKKIELRLVTNLSLMTEERYEFLIKNKVTMCTSLDGPKKLHNRNRPMIAGDCYGNVVKWIRRFNRDYPKLKKTGYIWKLGAIIVISRYSLKYHKQIVDEYIKLGFNGIFLHSLNPFGFSQEVWDKIKYSADDFIKFYKNTLDYIIKKNLRGPVFVERLAKHFLTKILTDRDPNMMELRSPCGAGIGQLAYNYNGDVYTCDEGRMMSMMGEENFKIGTVEDKYEDLVAHPVTRTLCTSSCLETIPGCSDCAYLPYCGTCPIYNYFEQGNIYGQMPNNERCRINMAILDYLFEKLEDKKIEKVFQSWLDK